MKTNDKHLSGEEKRKLTEEAFCRALKEMSFGTDVLADFLLTIRKRNNEKLEILKAIEGGVDHWSRGNGDKSLSRAKFTYNETSATLLAVILRHSEYASDTVNSLRLDGNFIKSKACEDYRLMLQLSVMQSISYQDQINDNTYIDYRGLVKLLRNTLEVGRMELYLSGKPNYTPSIKQVNFFIWILEERVRIWDSQKVKPKKVKAIK